MRMVQIITVSVVYVGVQTSWPVLTAKEVC